VFFILFCNFVPLQPCIFLQFVCRWTTWLFWVFYTISFECNFFSFLFCFYFSTFHNNELGSKKSSKYSINEDFFQRLCESYLPNWTNFLMLNFLDQGLHDPCFLKLLKQGLNHPHLLKVLTQSLHHFHLLLLQHLPFLSIFVSFELL